MPGETGHPVALCIDKLMPSQRRRLVITGSPGRAGDDSDEIGSPQTSSAGLTGDLD